MSYAYMVPKKEEEEKMILNSEKYWLLNFYLFIYFLWVSGTFQENCGIQVNSQYDCMMLEKGNLLF